MLFMASFHLSLTGRTARAGRAGRAISFVTQYDIELVHAIEAHTGQSMVESTEITDATDVVPLLNKVSEAMREAQMTHLDDGSEDKMDTVRKRKRQQKRHLLRKTMRVDGNEGEQEEE